jgi:hypothetical protein
VGLRHRENINFILASNKTGPNIMTAMIVMQKVDEKYEAL